MPYSLMPVPYWFWLKARRRGAPVIENRCAGPGSAGQLVRAPRPRPGQELLRREAQPQVAAVLPRPALAVLAQLRDQQCAAGLQRRRGLAQGVRAGSGVWCSTMFMHHEIGIQAASAGEPVSPRYRNRRCRYPVPAARLPSCASIFRRVVQRDHLRVALRQFREQPAVAGADLQRQAAAACRAGRRGSASTASRVALRTGDQVLLLTEALGVAAEELARILLAALLQRLQALRPTSTSSGRVSAACKQRPLQLRPAVARSAVPGGGRKCGCRRAGCRAARRGSSA
jgi:hypothetical protein